jgi:DNA-binding HxlR family transcriptional regulator
MALLDLLGRRMTLRIIWELRGRRLNFRALIEAAETNPSILNLRLRELRDLGIVDHDDTGYGLTEMGADLLARLSPLTEWSTGWAKRIRSMDG